VTLRVGSCGDSTDTQLLGLEAAKAVYDMPTVPDVSILIRQGYPLNRQLDASAGELVLRKIEALGVTVKTHCEPTSVVTTTEGPDERFAGFEHKDGRLDSDMVIFAIGIKPRDDLGRSSDLKIAPRGGIEVGNDLQSSVKDIYAIGECASWRGNVRQSGPSALCGWLTPVLRSHCARHRNG